MSNLFYTIIFVLVAILALLFYSHKKNQIKVNPDAVGNNVGGMVETKF